MVKRLCLGGGSLGSCLLGGSGLGDGYLLGGGGSLGLV